MAGQSVEDAHNAQCASRQSHSLNDHNPTPPPASAKLANTESSSTSSANQPIVINGVTYAPVSSQLPVPVTTSAHIVHTTSAYITKVIPDSDISSPVSLDSYTSYLAMSGPLKASVDWSSSSCLIDSTMAETSPVPSHTAHVLLANVNSMPFLLDLGASAHISPERSDFKHLCPIAHHTIEGFNGSSTTAVGVGDINLCTGSGHTVKSHSEMSCLYPHAPLALLPSLPLQYWDTTLSPLVLRTAGSLINLEEL